MIKHYDVYAIDADDLDAAAEVISRTLNVTMKEDEDGDFGGKYYDLYDEAIGHLQLFFNWNPYFDRWIDNTVAGYKMILDISGAPNGLEIERALKKIKEFKVTLLMQAIKDTETKEFKEVFVSSNLPK